MRRTLLLLTTMVVALLLASGVALAVNKVGTNGPDTLRGTNGDDNLLGRGGNDKLFSLNGRDNLLGGPGKDNVISGNKRRPGGGDKNLGFRAVRGDVCQVRAGEQSRLLAAGRSADVVAVLLHLASGVEPGDHVRAAAVPRRGATF